MRSGRLRHRAELQSQQETQDGSGGVTMDWVKERDIWCRIEPVSVVQQMESMRRNSPIDHEITARWNDDITTQKRIVHKGREFRIQGVTNPDGLEREAHIIAASGVPT